MRRDYGLRARSCFSLSFTWADGYVKSTHGCAGIYVINSVQYPSPSVTVKKDWKEYQGPPAVHFSLAKSSGYDFYITTDHSQEAAFQPMSTANPAWAASKEKPLWHRAADL